MPLRILEQKLDLTALRLHPSEIPTHFTYLLHVYISEEPSFLQGRRPPKIEAADIPWKVRTI